MSGRSKTWIGVGLGAAALALLAWLAWSSGAAERRAADEAASAARLAGAERAAEPEPDAGLAGPDAGVLAVVPSARRPLALAPGTRSQPDPGAENGSVAGFVLAWGSGRPIPGAELTFARGGTTRAVRADGDGYFFYAPGEAGDHELALATAQGFLPFAPEWGHSPVRVHLAPGIRLDPVRITLVEEVRTTVEVRDAAGAPVAGAEVMAFGLEQGERALAPLTSRWRTGEDGRAAVLVPEGALLEASHPERGRGRARLDARAEVQRLVRITLGELAPAEGRIAGRVLGPDGAPIAGALISGRHLVAAGLDLHPPLTARSDVNGAFLLQGADEGPHRVVVVAAGFARATLEPVATGGSAVEVRLVPEARLRVQVRDDATGQPIVAASVLVERPRGALEVETLALASGYGADGIVELTGLPEGPCRVMATSPGYAVARAEARAHTGEPATVELRLGRGGTIAGRVISGPEGPGLAGARVTLEGRLGEGSSAVPLQLSAVTDPRGAFVLEGAPPGTASLLVMAEGHHGRVRAGIAVTAGARTELGDVDLSALAEGEAPGIELAGVGAVLAAEGDVMRIRSVVAGGGAVEAGLTPGDAILAIEGVPVGELGFEGCVERIRGPEGTEVRLTVQRQGREEPEALAVPRRRVRA